MPYRLRQAIAESKIGGRKKTHAAAIVPTPPAALVPPRSREDIEAMITRIVRERVDEILVTLEAGRVEPDFLPKDEGLELRRRQNVFEQRKWSLYFEKWGCRGCHRKNVPHSGTGHCNTCESRLSERLKQIRAEWESENPESEIDRQIDRLTSGFRVAKSLLNRG